MRHLFFLLALLGGFILSAVALVPARADDQKPDAERIARLIKQLGSDTFDEREAASKELAKIGPVALDALLHVRAELLQRPLRARHADDGHVEVPALRQRLERGEDLLVREIAARAEEDEAVGAGRAHAPGSRSRWPPNSKRIAESTRSWKSASPHRLVSSIQCSMTPTSSFVSTSHSTRAGC